MPRTLPLDPYIADVLMRDLVGHDRSSVGFPRLSLAVAGSRGEGRARIGASLQTIATRTGLSKSAVQKAVAPSGPAPAGHAPPVPDATDAPTYEVHEPWRR